MNRKYKKTFGGEKLDCKIFLKKTIYPDVIRGGGQNLDGNFGGDTEIGGKKEFFLPNKT